MAPAVLLYLNTCVGVACVVCVGGRNKPCSSHQQEVLPFIIQLNVCFRVYLTSISIAWCDILEGIFFIDVVVVSMATDALHACFLCKVSLCLRSRKCRARSEKQNTEQPHRGNPRWASLFRSNNGTGSMTWLVNVQNSERGGRQITTGFSLDQTSQVGEERSRLCSVILCNSAVKRATQV